MNAYPLVAITCRYYTAPGAFLWRSSTREESIRQRWYIAIIGFNYGINFLSIFSHSIFQTGSDNSDSKLLESLRFKLDAGWAGDSLVELAAELIDYFEDRRIQAANRMTCSNSHMTDTVACDKYSFNEHSNKKTFPAKKMSWCII